MGITKCFKLPIYGWALGSILEPNVLKRLPTVDAVFIDPDWAVTGPDHEYRFRRSNTQPPADVVLENMLKITSVRLIIE